MFGMCVCTVCMHACILNGGIIFLVLVFSAFIYRFSAKMKGEGGNGGRDAANVIGSGTSNRLQSA